jgi:hypothetical protein
MLSSMHSNLASNWPQDDLKKDFQPSVIVSTYSWQREQTEFTSPSKKLVSLSVKLQNITVYHCDDLLEVGIVTEGSAKSTESGQALCYLSVCRDELFKGTDVIRGQLQRYQPYDSSVLS